MIPGMMVFPVQRDENLSIERADRPAVVVGDVDAAGGQTDIIHDAFQFPCRNRPADDFFNVIAQGGGLFHPRARPRADV